MKVRGRLRAVWLALWLAGAAGCVLVGIYGDTPESPHEWWWLPLFLFLAAVSVGVAVRGFGRGLDADGNGVVVRNMLRARPIPWRDLAAIEFKGVDSEAITNMYYQLVFQRHDGSRVTAEAPGGGIDPGEYLFELRERLLAMRSAALGYPHPPADRPSDAASTDAEAALESVSDEPAKDWATIPAKTRETRESQRGTGQPIPAKTSETRERSPSGSGEAAGQALGRRIAGVAVALAFAFVPLPDLGSLLWTCRAPPTPGVDADANGSTGKICSPACASAKIQTKWTTSWSTVMPSTKKRSCHGHPSPKQGVARGCGRRRRGAQKCKPAFASYVGLELDESRLDLDFLTPDKDSWTAGKATLICLVLDPDHDQITRALRGAHE